jgi:hypothetical protein
VRHHGEEARLRAVGCLGLVARHGQGAFGEDAGDVASDALHLAAAVGANRDLTPGDPSRAVGGGDFLVLGARAIGEETGLVLLHDREYEAGAEQLFPRPAGKRAIGVVDIGDRAGAVPAHDQVVLRLEKAGGALLRFAYFPITVGGLIETPLEIEQLELHLADARNENSHRAAGGAEQ